jgi:phosphatidylglycerol lysyltransferase
VLVGADVDALGDVVGDDSLALAIDAALLELLELALGPVVRHADPSAQTHAKTIRFNIFYLSCWSSRARRITWLPMELLAALRIFGRDAVSFQALEPGLSVFRTEDATVAYRDTGGAWVAVGSPLAKDRHAAMTAFADAARADGKRAVFFACEDETASAVCIGEQPWWRAGDWPRVLRDNRRLREQLRRSRKKGITVRAVAADDLAEGKPLRARADALANAWLGSRPMQPMQFLLTLAMFEHAAEHRYYGAFQGPELVAFMSLVPIYEKGAWLVEDVVRDAAAPNGTTELLFDAVMRESPGDTLVTWGLAPLAGSPWPMRAIGALARGLYDFRGLRAFKARLHPREWQRVLMVAPRAPAWLAVFDVLRAFAGGSLVLFGVRTLARRPLATAWVLSLLLVPWTAMLAVMLSIHRAVGLLGFPRGELFGWFLFDALFAIALIRAFWRPRFSSYAALGGAAAVDAIVSTLHVAHAGLGTSTLSAITRIAAAVAPAIASLSLFRCALAVNQGGHAIIAPSSAKSSR